MTVTSGNDLFVLVSIVITNGEPVGCPIAAHELYVVKFMFDVVICFGFPVYNMHDKKFFIFAFFFI